MILSDASKRRLTIAKEIYSHGYIHSMNRSPSDVILAILNFDYCVETIVKAVLLDANITLRSRGRPKSFDELIEGLRNIYPTLGYTSEALSLHKLRNDVQHHSLIPSQQEVGRHVITAKSFFDEVCLKAYDGSITFTDISLALFIVSEVEKTILAEMEKALQEGRHSDAVFYAKKAVAYHVILLRYNMQVPYTRSFTFLPSDLRRTHLRELENLGEFVEATEEALNWIVDRLCLRDYYDEIDELLGGLRYVHADLIERKIANHDSAERARNVVYDFITRTQDLIHKSDLESPYIFDHTILDKSATKCNIQIGFASAAKIVEAKLTLKEQNVEKSVQNISTQIGLQTVEVKDLEKGKTYNLFAWVKNEKDRVNEKYLIFKMD